MKIQILLFSQLKDALGGSEVAVELPEPATGKDLFNALSRKNEKVEGLLKISRLAVGQEYVAWDHPIAPGQEVALIPPVSGG